MFFFKRLSTQQLESKKIIPKNAITTITPVYTALHLAFVPSGLGGSLISELQKDKSASYRIRKKTHPPGHQLFPCHSPIPICFRVPHQLGPRNFFRFLYQIGGIWPNESQ